jgi:DNA-binding transcriptional regulator YiaG
MYEWARKEAFLLKIKRKLAGPVRPSTNGVAAKRIRSGDPVCVHLFQDTAVKHVPHIAAARPQRFAQLMKTLRAQFAGKQLAFAVAVGRTDAAVSMWESGRRVPADKTLQCILAVLAEAGTPANHLADLTEVWKETKTLRQAASRRPPLPRESPRT